MFTPSQASKFKAVSRDRLINGTSDNLHASEVMPAETTCGLLHFPKSTLRSSGALPIRDRLKVLFRAEPFNVYNHSNFGGIQTHLSSPHFGDHDYGRPDSPAAEIPYAENSPDWRLPAPYLHLHPSPVQFFAIDTMDLSEKGLDPRVIPKVLEDKWSSRRSTLLVHGNLSCIVISPQQGVSQGDPAKCQIVLGRMLRGASSKHLRVS